MTSEILLTANKNKLYEVLITREIGVKVIVAAPDEDTAKALGAWVENFDDDDCIALVPETYQIDYTVMDASKGAKPHITVEEADKDYPNWREWAEDEGLFEEDEDDDLD